jgi:hypothetical protein
MEVSGQLHSLPVYLREKFIPVVIDKRLDGSKKRSGRCEEEKYIFSSGNQISAF